jgi:hydroxyacylglutathione hydrolase
MILQLRIGLLDSNCYLVYERDGGEAAIVDPGFSRPDQLEAEVRRRNLRVAYILNTHGHFDHVIGAPSLTYCSARYGIHPADRDLLANGGGAASFGLPVLPMPAPDLDLIDGTVLNLGALSIKVVHTPGHTPGCVCLYLPEEEALLTGDTLFRGSVGRTDLPGGDARLLTQSLKRLLTLPPATRIYPGHGDASTLGREGRHNPWLRRTGA